MVSEHVQKIWPVSASLGGGGSKTWAHNPALQKSKRRLSAPGLALQGREKAYVLKNSATRGSEKYGASIATEDLRKSQNLE